MPPCGDAFLQTLAKADYGFTELVSHGFYTESFSGHLDPWELHTTVMWRALSTFHHNLLDTIVHEY